MKRMRRILCCLIVVCIIAAAVPVQAQAAYGNSCTLCGGNCTGYSSDEAPLHRIYGASRYDTSFAIADKLKQHMGVKSFNTVIVASGTGFADALAGSYLASIYDAPILLSNGKNDDQIRRYINDNLVKNGTVLILGGTNAVSAKLASTLSGYYIQRLWGNTRYETNLAILQYAADEGKEILVCTGKGFADSLSASAAGRPILLVNEQLTDAQKDYLAGTTGKKIIIGGTGAVSAKIEEQLRSYGDVERIGGNTRYETSVLVAQRFFGAPTKAVLAYAQNFPDGLCGGALANYLGAPMILTATGKESAAIPAVKGQDISHGYVLGGTGLISDDAVRAIFAPARLTSNTRPSYDIGNCRELSGKVNAVLFFVDDNESSWNQEKVDQQWNDQVTPGLDFLELWASNWGVSLEFETGGYYTGMREGVKVHYDGIIYGDTSQAWNNRYILEDIAISLGFSSAEDMDEYLQEYYGRDDLVYMVMVNKDGRSYSYPDSKNDGDDLLEHCVIFTDFQDYTSAVPPSTVAHEVLHLFGAEDYYDPYGDLPNRHALAEEIYHDDIMLRVYISAVYNNVGAFTAYTVGWSDEMPPECDCPEWWS